jgi:hypothetical protein
MTPKRNEQPVMWSVLRYDTLANILQHSQCSARLRYQNQPLLAGHLIYNIQSAHEDCAHMKRQPQEILQGYLDNEQRIVKAWNEHRLGTATPQKILEATPAQVSSLYNMDDNIPDQEVVYPIRMSASLLLVPFQHPEPLPPFIDPITIASRMRMIQAQTKDALTALTTTTPEMRTPSTAANTPRSKYNKLEGAPSQNLPFPQTPGNLTVAEILCFVPSWLKSVDIVERFISNGGTAGTMSKMLNVFRDMGNNETVISSNSVLRLMQPSMRKYAKEYEHWTVGSHQAAAHYDASSISVAEFRIPRETHNDCKESPKSIPFKDLAYKVRNFPQGKDALDLTRCVLWHLQPDHQKETWNFPDDFNALIERIGGPALITEEHRDAAAFDRWTPARNRAAAEAMFGFKRDGKGRMLKRPRDETPDSAADVRTLEDDNSASDASMLVTKKRRRNQPSKRHQDRSITAVHRRQAIVPDVDSDEDVFKGSRRTDIQARKNIKQKTFRRSTRVSEDKRVTYDAELSDSEDLE